MDIEEVRNSMMKKPEKDKTLLEAIDDIDFDSMDENTPLNITSSSGKTQEEFCYALKRWQEDLFKQEYVELPKNAFLDDDGDFKKNYICEFLPHQVSWSRKSQLTNVKWQGGIDLANGKDFTTYATIKMVPFKIDDTKEFNKLKKNIKELQIKEARDKMMKKPNKDEVK